jgi:hypothetical protein
MIKNTLSVLIFFLSLFFFYLIGSIYLSNNQVIKIKKNRETILISIQNNITKLPKLSNDTNNIIKFNSGFDSENKKIERNFWKLFKKND